MNPLSFLIAAWLMFGLELGLRDALELGATGIAPSFVIVLLAMISLLASKRAALWAGLLLGVLMDLTHTMPGPGGFGAVVTVGPYALGSLLAAYSIVTLRALVIKRNPITLVFLSAVAAFLVNIVFVAIMTARSWYDPMIEFSPVAELLQRLGVAAYSGGLALVLGPLLLYFSPLLGFTAGDKRHQRRRS